jgi:hypothetical protein
MDNWISVVTNPLGLAAFFVAALYLLLSKTKLASQVTWAPHAFVGIAILGAIGGLALAFLHRAPDKPAQPEGPPAKPATVTASPAPFSISINGIVSDTESKLLKGVRIQLFDEDTGTQVGKTVETDRNGSFVLQIQSSDLEKRRLRVSAQKDNLEPAGTVQLGHDQFRLSIVLTKQQE